MAEDGARRRYERVARALGYPAAPAGWTPVGAGAPARSATEVADRLLVVLAVVAVGGGGGAEDARRWLDLVGATAALEAGEADYLDDAADGVRVEDAARRLQAEAAAVLGWALDLLDEPSWEHPVDGRGDATPRGLPSPTRPGALPAELVDPVLLPDDVLADAFALAERLLAGLALDPDLQVGDAPGEVDPYVVRERHRALAWLHGAPWAP